MEAILGIATILGGISAVWFFYDKRQVIAAWFKLNTKNTVSPPVLSDEEFLFAINKKCALLQNEYLPVDANEASICRSLVNQGVLIKRGEQFRLSRAGKKMLGV